MTRSQMKFQYNENSCLKDLNDCRLTFTTKKWYSKIFKTNINAMNDVIDYC